ncbi:NAD(P)/FAD-dependent oxidoreductase [Micromonospora tarensis]|uniref:NAD(P)/FAD-dependent oxidoreductase n=1 Tax=Micromonospora tarensis TaxID=2806100 RepID=A0ABS1YHS4_9ACTN|nr:NAD(P)/FAD-dependent oxidoreductase [Micromonospora tarensis]MBM0276868.1 NAD(P)/FAD-dependent oxidoreductase [Micromonospora tarensis]
MARPVIVIVGAGFAGFHAARRLTRLARGAADVVLVNPTDYFLYLPLLPEVAGGVLDPRRVAVPLADTLPGVRVVVGEVDGVDVDGRSVSYTDADGRQGRLAYHRLVLAAGSVNKLLPIPGVADHAHGFRGIPEAVHLRERLIQQIELADATEDPAERASRCTFVVVGAGYTGTEVAAQGQLFTGEIARRHPRLGAVRPRWLLLDTAERVLPALADRMSAAAERVLRERGVEVCLGTSVTEADADGVRLNDGRFVPSRTLVWCVGVRPDPLVEATGLPVTSGRITVDEYLAVPGHPEILACGDAAAVPDPSRPGEITPMTAQHAVRQGRLAADNIAASYGVGRRRPYRHRDLGFVVDLGGWQPTANPLHVPLTGSVARAVARGYHLLSLPANRTRTVADWLFSAAGTRPAVQLGLVPGAAVPLDTAPELIRR